MMALMDAIGNVVKRRLEESGKSPKNLRIAVKLAVMHLLSVRECTHEELYPQRGSAPPNGLSGHTLKLGIRRKDVKTYLTNKGNPNW